MISDLIFKSGGAGGGGMGGGSQIQETFYMHVPAGKTGLVIGKGGETIKQVQQIFLSQTNNLDQWRKWSTCRAFS